MNAFRLKLEPLGRIIVRRYYRGAVWGRAFAVLLAGLVFACPVRAIDYQVSGEFQCCQVNFITDCTQQQKPVVAGDVDFVAVNGDASDYRVKFCACDTAENAELCLAGSPPAGCRTIDSARINFTNPACEPGFYCASGVGGIAVCDNCATQVVDEVVTIETCDECGIYLGATQSALPFYQINIVTSPGSAQGGDVISGWIDVALDAGAGLIGKMPPQNCTNPIPSVSEWGMVIMALGITTWGAFVVRKFPG